MGGTFSSNNIALALIKAGANIKAKDKDNQTPYIIASTRNEGWGKQLLNCYQQTKVFAKRALLRVNMLEQQLTKQQLIIAKQEKMLHDLKDEIGLLHAQIDSYKAKGTPVKLAFPSTYGKQPPVFSKIKLKKKRQRIQLRFDSKNLKLCTIDHRLPACS